MKKEHISDALNMLNDDIIEETNNVRTNAKPKRKWVKWGVVAACLCLAVTITIPVLHHKGGPDTQDPVQNIAALEYNGKFYEAVKLPEVLEKYGLPPEITADMAGGRRSCFTIRRGTALKPPPIWLANTFPT